MKAIILNSGVGSRLGSYTKDKTKCMVTVKDDISIIQYQLELLKATGIQQVIITTGYMRDVLVDFINKISYGLEITYVHNENYKDTNYIKSLELTKEDEEDILLLHGDLIFSYDVLDTLIKYEKSCLIIDKSLPLPEKDFKAKMKGGLVKAVGIQYFGQDCYAAQPLYKLWNKDWKVWKKKINEFCSNENDKVYAEEALNCITDEIELYAIDVKGQLCNEIDNEEDLYRIRKLLNERDR
ncbi:MAG: hypothetical protein K0R00_552 [Herbinix sp.]|jgi:phosphoenolpyruvate phosphomutase|nr:hypothetical protein [Herbinix sp.]